MGGTLSWKGGEEATVGQMQAGSGVVDNARSGPWLLFAPRNTRQVMC